jgi:ubiquinone/menaquinone biosynthesis C-methylase UbiE
LQGEHLKRVDYDAVAPTFDERYAHHRYSGIERALTHFIGAAGGVAALEVGCGTGHWLGHIAALASVIAGVDRSWEMLTRARETVPSALLLHAAAEHLPIESQRFDRIFCINALHHFTDQLASLYECRRVLRPGGAFLTIGLDPHTGDDSWWIYDYFPSALAADRRRYAPTTRIREILVDVGFSSPRSEVVQHMPAVRPFAWMLTQGLLERHSTSQLMVISDAEYEAGMRRLSTEQPTLRSDLRLFGTFADVPPS